MPDTPLQQGVFQRLLKTLHVDYQGPMRKALGWLLLLLAVQFVSVLWPETPGFNGIPYYLELHALMEVISIIVSAMVFAVAWSTRIRGFSASFTVLAAIFLAVGVLDFAHTLSYAGMPDYFSPNLGDKHLNFWMAARLLTAAGLLIIAVRPWKTPLATHQKYTLLAGMLAIVVGWQWVVIQYPNHMPQWFVAGVGLTPLKINTEYLIIALNVLAAAILWQRMQAPQPFHVVALFSAVCVLAMSELFFTLYSTMHGAYNVLGHVYKVIAYVLIYRAFVVEAIERPYKDLEIAQQTLKQEEVRFRRAVEAAPNAMLMVDDTQTIILSNTRSDVMFRFKSGQLVGTKLDTLIPESLRHKHREHIQTYLASPADRPMGQDRFLYARRHDGELFRVEVGLTPLTIDNRTFVLASIVDITSRLEAEARIEKLIYYDTLTDLPNRQLLKDRVSQLITAARQSHHLIALLYVDLDRFKNINETLGHTVGDQLLVDVARRLTRAAGDEATVARVVGDEFAIVASLPHAEDAARLARLLLANISKPYKVGAHHLTLTPSIGIALYPEDGADFDTLMKSADMAMQLVKLEGRNDFHFFAKEMQQRTSRMLNLESALLSAIDNNELQLVYQPQVRISDRKVIGVEALLRWHHPEFGQVSPAEFMPIAENSGQIITIGAWVLKTAAAQLKQWLAQGHAPMIMSVNLSAIQFRHPNLTGLVDDILAKTELPPEYLELELTESAAMLNPDHAIRIMQTLHRRGIRLSIDDFGTGYSSLSYLKKFNVYKLKIDQSFVRDIATDGDDRAIVSAIIQMANSLGFHTIAEGVETQAQLDYLRAQGCDEIQGYLYSKPLPAEALGQWLIAARTET